MTWWFIPLWLLLIFLNMPLAFSLAVASTALLLYQGHDLYIILQRMLAGPDSFPLLAVPFFILAGNLMNSSGVTLRIFRFARTLVGHIPGGLGHVNVVASMIFAGMSGSAVADAAGLGVMEIKAMHEAGYDDDFSAAVTAASATIGPIIPPSIPMVLFGVLSGASVGKLFLGGFIPGVLMGLGLMAVIYFIGRRRKYHVDRRSTFKEVFTSFLDALWALFTPVVIMGGILSGIFTPTEAAIATVVYAMLISIFVYRTLNLKDIKQALTDTVEFTANIMFIVAAANLFGWILTKENIPQQFAVYLALVSTNPTIIMLIIAAFVLFLGCFMEGTAMMMILVPILMPVTMRLGIDPVHLGVVFVLVQMIGLLTPPFAVNINIVSCIAGTSFGATSRAMVPFIAILSLTALLCVLVPDFVLFLPNLLFRR
jgi:tripartite ATP-independent transporter DctM subunit